MAAAALCLSATGCGGGADRAQARATTERFFAALQRHDGSGACAQLSKDTRASIESQVSKPCADAIGSLSLKPERVMSVQVFITNAKADVSGGESVFLDRDKEGWRVSAVGCKPQGGTPTNIPFDCEAQA